MLARGATRAATVGGYADALAEFDAQLFSTLTYNVTDRPRNVGPGNVFNPVVGQARDGNYLLALSKRTATGGVWTARQTIAYSQNNTAIGVGRAVPSDWTAAFELEVNHPLLRGAGVPRSIDCRSCWDGCGPTSRMASFEAAVRNLVLDVERTYWDLHCAYRIVEANKEGRDAASLSLAKGPSACPQEGSRRPGAAFRRAVHAVSAPATRRRWLPRRRAKACSCWNGGCEGLMGLTADRFVPVSPQRRSGRRLRDSSTGGRS